MATIAEALGITWTDDIMSSPKYRLTYHAQRQAAEKGWTSADVLMAANRPLHTSRSVKVPGQVRHVRGDLVAIVDPDQHLVITVYRNQVETAPRADQVDGPSLAYAKRLRSTIRNGSVESIH